LSIDFLRWLLGSAGEVCHTSSAVVEDGQAGCNVQVNNQFSLMIMLLLLLMMMMIKMQRAGGGLVRAAR